MTVHNFTDRELSDKISQLSNAKGKATLALRHGDVQTAREYSDDVARLRDELTQMRESRAASALRNNETALARAANQMDRTYERLDDKGSAYLAEAQRGQDGVGRFASDVVAAGAQMLGDAAANAIVPGSGLAMLGARSFGDASQRARLNGASINEQFGYGIGNAATEMLTEKMFDGLAGVYGKGAADDIAKPVVNKFGKTEGGRAAFKALSSMGGEAIEEVVSGAIEPALGSIYNGKAVRDNYSRDTAADIAHNALVGGVLGGIGGAADVAQNGISPTYATLPLQAARGDAIIGKTSGTEGTWHGERQAGDRAGAVRADTGGNFESGTGTQAQDGRRPRVSSEIREIQQVDGRLLFVRDKAEQVNRHTKDYGTTAHIEETGLWTSPNLAFTDKNGEIHIRSDAPAEMLDEILGHESTHVMKRKGYQPYLDFSKKIADRVNFASEAGDTLLMAAAEHRGIDLSKPLSTEEIFTLSDEIASLVRGAEMSGHVDDIHGDLREAFDDYDAFARELNAIHQQYVSDIASARRPSDFDSTPTAYAALLKHLTAEGTAPTVLTPRQRMALDAWNASLPEMHMSEEEFLER